MCFVGAEQPETDIGEQRRRAVWGHLVVVKRDTRST